MDIVKKYLTIVVCFFSLISFSQKEKVISAKIAFDAGDLVQAQNDIDIAIQDKLSASKSRTWKYRGDIYYALYNSGKLRSHETAKKASESYIKAMSIDDRYKNELLRNCRLLGDLSLNKGVTEFNQKNYTEAIRDFEMAVNVAECVGKTDSLSIYNIALSNERAGNDNQAIKYYQKCININHKSEMCYSFIIFLYQKNGDSENAKQVLGEARKKYPKNPDLLITEINIFLKEGRNEEVVVLFQQAIENNPQNEVLFFSLGSVYDGIGNYEAAENVYLRAISIDPKYFDALYNLGALYFNQGVGMNNKALEEVDLELYKKYQENAETLFNQATIQLERAIEVRPKDQNTLLSLKQLYARAGNNEKYEEVKSRLNKEK